MLKKKPMTNLKIKKLQKSAQIAIILLEEIRGKKVLKKPSYLRWQKKRLINLTDKV